MHYVEYFELKKTLNLKPPDCYNYNKYSVTTMYDCAHWLQEPTSNIEHTDTNEISNLNKTHDQTYVTIPVPVNKACCKETSKSSVNFE